MKYIIVSLGVILYDLIVISIFSYVIFWKGYSGWWFIVALSLMAFMESIWKETIKRTKQEREDLETTIRPYSNGMLGRPGEIGRLGKLYSNEMFGRTGEIGKLGEKIDNSLKMEISRI